MDGWMRIMHSCMIRLITVQYSRVQYAYHSSTSGETSVTVRCRSTSRKATETQFVRLDGDGLH